jgi:hypothetical protein
MLRAYNLPRSKLLIKLALFNFLFMSATHPQWSSTTISTEQKQQILFLLRVKYFGKSKRHFLSKGQSAVNHFPVAFMRGVFMADSVVFAQLLLHTDWRKKQKTHA